LQTRDPYRFSVISPALSDTPDEVPGLVAAAELTSSRLPGGLVEEPVLEAATALDDPDAASRLRATPDPAQLAARWLASIDDACREPAIRELFLSNKTAAISSLHVRYVPRLMLSCLCPPYKWGRRHNVFGLSVRLYVRGRTEAFSDRLAVNF